MDRCASGDDRSHRQDGTTIWVELGLNDDDVSEIIQKNRELGSILQIQGTPTFIVGDAFIRGYAELEQMREIVRLVREEQG